MPCYNSEKYIKQAIESVLTQSHQNLELLICDDGSSDRSADVISDCMKSDKRIKYFVNFKFIEVKSLKLEHIKKFKNKFIFALDEEGELLNSLEFATTFKLLSYFLFVCVTMFEAIKKIEEKKNY